MVRKQLLINNDAIWLHDHPAGRGQRPKLVEFDTIGIVVKAFVYGQDVFHDVIEISAAVAVVAVVVVAVVVVVVFVVVVILVV